MSEVIQDSLGFWVPLCGFRIEVLDFGYLVNRIPIS